MIRTSPPFVIAVTGFALVFAPVSAQAQTPLTLQEAIARATSENVEARIAAIAEQEAAHRVTQARAGYLPRVEASESWQRGDQPVFVFSSRLAQRRFTAGDFALDALNHPDATDNFRVALGVEQSIYDGGATRARVRAATLTAALASAGRDGARQALAVHATEAYGAVLQADAATQTAGAALEAADADLQRAVARRDAGLATDADVLAVEVHRAAVEEMQLRAALQADLARADLNRVIGEPLDETFALAPLPPDAGDDIPAASVLEAEALVQRPELRQASIAVDLAGARVVEARSGFLPQVFAQGGWEANGATWGDRAGSWAIGAGVRLDLFRGLADKAKVAEAGEAERRRRLERDRVETAIRVEVRTAVSRLATARSRQALSQRVVAQADERQRIVRDRYEQGMADATALLRAAEAMVQAREQQVRARIDVLVERAVLDRAIGR